VVSEVVHVLLPLLVNGVKLIVTSPLLSDGDSVNFEVSDLTILQCDNPILFELLANVTVQEFSQLRIEFSLVQWKLLCHFFPLFDIIPSCLTVV